jgi:hypothetical protein
MSFAPRPSARPTYVRPIVGDPVSVVPQAVVPRPVDPRAAAPRGPTRLTLSVRTSSEAACGALRDAVGALGGAPGWRAADSPPPTVRWEHEGSPPPPITAESPAAECSAAGDRFRGRGACGADNAAPPSPRDVAYAALGAYAHALRHDGMPFGTALATLGTAVDDAAALEAEGLLPPALLAAVQRDVAQCCRAAFAAT